MSETLSEFLLENPISDEVVSIYPSERFKKRGLAFKIRPISGKEFADYQSECTVVKGQGKGRNVLCLETIGVGLVRDLVTLAAATGQRGLIVAGIDVIELGLEIDQRVVWRVAVVQCEVLCRDIAATELFP